MNKQLKTWICLLLLALSAGSVSANDSIAVYSRTDAEALLRCPLSNLPVISFNDDGVEVRLKADGKVVLVRTAYKDIGRIDFLCDPRAVSGDVNGDGVVNIADIITIVKRISDAEDVESGKSGDVNGDGEVNHADLKELINSISGK